MTYVEFACEGRLLMRVPSVAPAAHVPRIGEVVVLDERPYEVVDVEYWARRPEGNRELAGTWPTVHVIPFAPERWERRLERRRLQPMGKVGSGRY